jgi:hypothetical protein
MSVHRLQRRVLAAALLAAASLTGCGVRLGASHIVVRMDQSGMHLVQVDDRPAAQVSALPGGETVIQIINGDRTSAHTVKLVRGVRTPAQIPARVLTARLPSDDPERILEISERLDKDTLQISPGGSVIDDPAIAGFHDYLQPGIVYMLVDTAQLSHDYYLVLSPH